MSLLSLKGVEKSFGAKKILNGVSFTLNQGNRAGLIGVNGSGKTTLLGIIKGRLEPDTGEKAVQRGASIGFLEQEAKIEGAVSILDEMLSARPKVLELKHLLDRSAGMVSGLAHSGGAVYENALEEYSRILDEFERTGGYAYENLVMGALAGLGFGSGEFGRDIGTLSGGERTRLSLAKLLLAGHDLLMLDEPTNHLDIPSILWLEEFLKSYSGTILLVSHDRYFLDRVTTRTLELEDGVVEEYPGNYSVYRIEKQKRTSARLKQYELASARLEKEKEYINRMRAGVNSKQAKGREKRLSRFELPDRPATTTREIKLGWSEVKRSSDSVLKVDGIKKSFEGNEVLKEVSFTLRRGERAGIVGRNGGGKSTLVKVILGSIKQDSGDVAFGPNVKVAYYAQGLEGLTGSNTVLEELWSAEPMAVEQKIRDILGAFLFSGDNALKKVEVLSGGEKGRLAIAKIVLAGANLLILDEPTNHLDIQAREALEEALSSFGGTVLTVSHDRYFLDSIAEKIYEIKDGTLTEYLGNYSDYTGKKTDEAKELDNTQAEGRMNWEERKQKQAEEKKKERELLKKAERIEGIESEIEGLEKDIKEVEAILADPVVYGDYDRFTMHSKRYNELSTRLDRLYGLLEEELI